MVHFMICPYCGNSVALGRRICEFCGFDLEPAKKLVERSNVLYNRGLKMAKVRNLSGAIPVLEKSLELNKHNSDARNLLGLIYYETGDIVEALSSWLISRHLDPEDNEADYFLEKVQRDTAELDSMNLAIRKYNSALKEARQHNFDLAIIQLKKAISINKKFLKAYQLLTLIYMEDREHSKAYRLINSGLAIDIGNTALLRYRQELTGDSTVSVRDEYSVEADEAKDKPIAAKFSYKEDKPSIFPFVNLILGVIIGIICSQWLVVPTVKKNMKEVYENSRIDYSAELAAKSATINQLQKTVTTQEKKIAELENNTGSSQGGIINVNNENYAAFFEAWEEYRNLKEKEYTDDELVTLAYKLWKIKDGDITQGYASDMLKTMRDEVYPVAAKKVYSRAKDLFEREMYEEAITWLSAASDMDKENENPIYYIGRSYQALEKYQEALEYFRKTLEIAPNTTLKELVEERIEACEKELS